MRSGISWLLISAIAALAVGCRQKSSSSVSEASASVDAGVPGAPELKVRLAFLAQDGGVVEETLSTDAPTQLEPDARRLVVETNQSLRNVRIRLFDESDKVVPSDDSVEELADRIRDTLDLSMPLKAGHRYQLTFDGQSGAAMLDAFGKPLSNRRYPLQVTGEREKSEKAAKPKKRTKPNHRRKKH